MAELNSKSGKQPVSEMNAAVFIGLSQTGGEFGYWWSSSLPEPASGQEPWTPLS